MRAAIYCRLSEEDRHKQSQSDDSASIHNQKLMLLQYAREQGWEVAGVYSDDDYAGSDRRRPAFNQLLRDAEARRFDVVLCKTQSRFTRELELVERYIHDLFPRWGVRFVSVVDNADTDNKGNKKARQINGLVNEWYLEDMSENIRGVLTARRMEGCHIGAFAPYGYRKDPDRRGHLLIDEEAAAIVRAVFDRYASGWGKTAIARWLNGQGVPNPTAYKRRQGLRYQPPKGRASMLWTYSAIASMLTNEVYIGHLVQGKYGSVSYKTRQNRPRPRTCWLRAEDAHEPIIDRALWQRVQGLVQARSKPFGRGEPGVFAGLARCAQCGGVMRSTVSKGRRYLQCASRHVSREACEGAFIAADNLEGLVLGELHRLAESCLDREALIRLLAASAGVQARREALQADIARLERRAAEYAGAMEALYLDRARGKLSEAECTPMQQAFAAEREKLDQAIARAGQALEALGAGDGEEAIRLAEEYIPPARLTRPMALTLIDRILVGRRVPGTRQVPVEIHWAF